MCEGATSGFSPAFKLTADGASLVTSANTQAFNFISNGTNSLINTSRGLTNSSEGQTSWEESIEKIPSFTSAQSGLSRDPWHELVGQVLAPSHTWKRDMDLYKDTVNVSFLLQYFRQSSNAANLVNRLFHCVHGREIGGAVPNVTVELVVHVDEPSNVSMWHDLTQQTRNGRFVVPVFSHNLGEVRGYNRVAHVARGQILFLLQDDAIPPEVCNWLPRVLSVFDTWPRVGILGLCGSRLSVHSATPISSYGLHSFARFEMLQYDQQSSIRMHFASLVDSSPMIYRRRIYWKLGEQNEATMGGKAESGIMTDWDMAPRVWLSGFQVTHMFLLNEEVFTNPPSVFASTHSGIRRRVRDLNQWLNIWDQENELIFEEVKRVNILFLSAVDPWL
eukprot:TRINITY_DN2311_c0_g1_i1.p1 TRINITY_DN2311_c0_g1~~TRINITY_DN2311_c0_g1_i1.p1  ORF type:complete len:390 (-),score=1.11 TRINITY_DN2311_c0_g1_i1:146-1315(-)